MYVPGLNIRKVLLSFLIFSGIQLYSQRIINFNLTQTENAVTARFTLTAGGDCGGYKLLHSTDSLNFLEVSNYSGVCGASGSSESFTETHKLPMMNQMNYYRIQLATFETSETRKIFVGNGGPQEALIVPNPVFSYQQEVRFKLQNAFNLKVQGFIYDQSGISKQFIDETTVGDAAIMDVSALYDGLYVLWLTDGTKAYRGKFIISR